MLQTMKEHRRDDKETELLRDFAEAVGDYERCKNLNTRRVSGTCEWFLGDPRFCAWRDRAESSLLWISIGPGRGKSVLSRCLIDEGCLNATTTIAGAPPSISTSSPTLCYFFFKEGGEGTMDGVHALSAILHQLYKHPRTSGLIQYALPGHKTDAKSLTSKFFELWRILTEAANRLMLETLSMFSTLSTNTTKPAGSRSSTL